MSKIIAEETISNGQKPSVLGEFMTIIFDNDPQFVSSEFKYF